jgi:predicted esterase
MLPAWFEAHSLTDTTEREDLQMEGIRQSVAYLRSILEQEVARLGGESGRVVIMGISQGGAIGMWTLLCQGNLDRRFGAFVGASTWLPFAANIQEFLGRKDDRVASKPGAGTGSSDGFVRDMMSAWSRSAESQLTGPSLPALSTPVILGHGSDDAFVGVELGRQAHRVLSHVGFQAEWKEYSGAELEGHWLKAPEQIDDIAAFLEKVTSSQEGRRAEPRISPMF